MTELQKLIHFMQPYYQTAADMALLEAYITQYTYAECAASALWYELKGKAGLQLQGVQKIDTGAEKFVYSEPGTMQLACQKNGDYYSQRCDDILGIGSCAVKVSRTTVGGVAETFGKSDV